MLNRLQETGNTVEVQDTTLALDVLGRYVCSTWDEAVNNGGVAFDVVVIGAGMFGAYCAEKMFRNSNLRVLVLEAGPFLVSEHVQNLSRIGLNAAGAIAVPSNQNDPGTRERVWGNAWRSQVAFPGLAYCLGGRSLYWGGWSPRLTAADLARWPKPIADFLQSADGTGDEYERTEKETGVFDKTDYIAGPLFDELLKKFKSVVGVVPTVDAIEEAPLAIQASPPASGLFSFDKYSSAPILTDAIRDASSAPDFRRRLFLVPRTHVTRLDTNGNVVTGLQVVTNGVPRTLSIGANCAVVVAASTIESTRLALESFPTPRMGRNLMAHLRSNTVVRIQRSAFDPLPAHLQAAALLVRGSTPQGRYHLQVTATAISGPDPEAVMFRMIPDIDLLDATLAAESAGSIVITLRGIGEMQGDKDPNATKNTGNPPSFVDLSDQTDEFNRRRAWVNVVKTADEDLLWNAMDNAAMAIAQAIAGDPAKLQVVSKSRDGLGTTHHEAGTLWMGTDPNASVTDLDGRFHHIANAYVAGPALFPTLGSANPSLTALSLARKTARAIVNRSLTIEADFIPLGTGGLAGWQMAGSGGFMELGGNIIESVDGIGLLWFTKQQFGDFILRVDWRATNVDDNSGVFIRFPALANDPQVAVDNGYEIQIDDTGKNPDTNPPTFGDALHQTGAVYTLAPSSKIASRPVGQWNNYEIEARGNNIKVTLNGEKVCELKNGTRPLNGHIGLQNHHPGSRVQFRNLRVKSV